MFEVGDLAFYPNHGIGRIEQLQTYEFDASTQCFYVLRILERDITVKIPCDRAEALGLRAIIPQDDVPRIFDILRERSKSGGFKTWNKRFREYTQKLKTGSPYEIAEVLRDLMLLQNSKELSFGERKMLEQAKGLLIKELSFAMSSDELDVTNEVVRVVQTPVAATIAVTDA